MGNTTVSSSISTKALDRDLRSLRWGGIAGIAGVLIYSAAFYRQGAFPSAAVSEAESFGYVTRVRGGALTQVVSSSLSAPLLTWMGVALAVAYAKGRRLMTAPALVGVGFTLLTVTSFDASSLFYGPIAYRVFLNPATANPELIHLFFQATAMAGLLLGGFTALAFGATAVVNAKRPLLPRWLGCWSAGMIAALNVIAVPTTVSITSGPLAPGSVLNALPIQLAYIWIVVAGAYMIRGPRTPIQQLTESEKY